MQPLLAEEAVRRLVRQTEPQVRTPTSPMPLVGPSINTILAVREHAPSEIVELETEIRSLHVRLHAAHARKQILEELVAVIERAETERMGGTGLSVVR